MKKIFVFVVLATAWIEINAQVPNKINYQAVAHGSDGSPLTNKNISLTFTLREASAMGSDLYSETWNTTTNALGIFTAEIGGGNPTMGTFSAINWGSGAIFLNIKIDPNGGTAYNDLGTYQMLSVPFALYAGESGNGFSGNYNDLANKPVTDGSETKVTGGNQIAVSGSGTAANPYQISAISTHYPGEFFGGGIVIYADNSGQHGFICSMTDLSNHESWSNVSGTVVGLSGQSDWDGQSNTNAIISQAGHTSSAAKLCDAYTNNDYGTGVFTDWYLPSVFQLKELSDVLYDVNKALDNDGNSSTLPLWKEAVYWSSTERDGNNAYYYGLGSIGTGWSGKYNFLFVRAFRSF